MKDELKILIAGDYCPQDKIAKLTQDGKHEEIYGELSSILKDKDYSIVNLECPITTSNDKIEKVGPHLKADPSVIDALKYINVDMVTLANNHIMDYGITGLIDTKKICDQSEIRTVGAGFTYEQATKPEIVSLKGRDVAILNFAEHEFSIATPTRGGANPYSFINIYDTILKVKDKCDIIIMIVHGGNEFYSLPSPRLVKEFQFFTKLGVSAVICHHSHYYSGYEIFNGKPIFYGLGNFIFDWHSVLDEKFRTGYFIKLNFNSENKCTCTLHPYKQLIEEPYLKPINTSEKKTFDEDILKLSKIIKDRKQLIKEWNKHCDQKSKFYIESIMRYGKIRKALSRVGIHGSKTKRKRYLLRMINYINCQSHRDILNCILWKNIGL